jgi:hypothetical protein
MLHFALVLNCLMIHLSGSVSEPVGHDLIMNDQRILKTLYFFGDMFEFGKGAIRNDILREESDFQSQIGGGLIDTSLRDWRSSELTNPFMQWYE